MGYYKNLEIELQEIHDPELREIVAWDSAHRDTMTARERWDTLTDEVKLQRALVLWDNSRLPKPKPAAEHVALQERVVRRRDLRQPKRSRMCVAGWAMIATAVVTSAVILGVNL